MRRHTNNRRIHADGLTHLGLQVTPEMKAILFEIAHDRQMSVGTLVRGILKGYLASRAKAEADARRAQDASVWPISQPRVAVGGGAR